MDWKREHSIFNNPSFITPAKQLLTTLCQCGPYLKCSKSLKPTIKTKKNEQTNKPLSNLRDHTPSWFMSATLLLLDFRLILEQSTGEVATALDLTKPIHLLSEALFGDLEGTLILWSKKWGDPEGSSILGCPGIFSVFLLSLIIKIFQGNASIWGFGSFLAMGSISGRGRERPPHETKKHFCLPLCIYTCMYSYASKNCFSVKCL